MQRLSIRRRSRRPKSPKWQKKASRTEIENSCSAGSPVEKNTNFHDESFGRVQAGSNGTSTVGSENHLSPESPDEKKPRGSGSFASVGISPSPSSGLLCNDEKEDTCDGNMKMMNGIGHPENVVVSPVDTSGFASSLSAPGADVDATIWQRRSALFLNTDDMVREGFMKTNGPPVGNVEGSNDSRTVDTASFEGSGIQARRNTSGSRGKRPMLTIEITPSGSNPSLQYVNVPAEKPRANQASRLHPGEWDRYDSEENVYHRLDKVIGQPGYQNLPGADKTMSSTSLSNSYQNVAGRLPGAHSYENVVGAPSEIHYINVEAKQQQAVNYIKVAGSGPPTPVQKNPSFNSRKANSDYSEIDFVKTKRLGEMSREAKKERVERVKKT